MSQGPAACAHTARLACLPVVAGTPLRTQRGMTAREEAGGHAPQRQDVNDCSVARALRRAVRLAQNALQALRARAEARQRQEVRAVEDAALFGAAERGGRDVGVDAAELQVLKAPLLHRLDRSRLGLQALRGAPAVAPWCECERTHRSTLSGVCARGGRAVAACAHQRALWRAADLEVGAGALADGGGGKVGDVFADGGPLERAQRLLVRRAALVLDIVAPVVGVPVHAVPVDVARERTRYGLCGTRFAPVCPERAGAAAHLPKSARPSISMQLTPMRAFGAAPAVQPGPHWVAGHERAGVAQE